LLACSLCGAGEVDSDGDGLSDFQETHKYLTDPAKADTDGDGIPDGDWQERQEYAYTVRTVLRFMPPLDGNALNDDYQDARVLGKSDGYVELEVIHYPFSTAQDCIEGNLNWRRDYADMTEYLRPGATTNWDDEMRRDLLAELEAEGIRVDLLTDRQLVEQVSTWLMKRSVYLSNVFTTFYVHFPNGQPKVLPGLEGAFEQEFHRDSNTYDWGIDRHFEHEVLGKGMFRNKTHGSCTSFAVYQATALKALGIPTRILCVIPAVDASDRLQLQLVREGLTHHRVRETILAGLRQSRSGFTNHTFNEVYVGHRWRRLDYNRLGPPVLDPRKFGLQTRLLTFNDLSEANLAPTWGRWYALHERSETFKHDNPYTAVAIFDRFGPHSHIANPPFSADGLASSPKPNIFILEPHGDSSSDRGVWDEVLPRVEDATFNKTGRKHEKEVYEDIFGGLFERNRGDIMVLAFSLDTKERVPAGYEDLLPKPWTEVEQALTQGKTVELRGQAREMTVILLAAPRQDQLPALARDTELLRFGRRRAPETAPAQSQPTTSHHAPAQLPSIWIMAPEGAGDLFNEVLGIVKDATYNKTGRVHSPESYREISAGRWPLGPGDVLVLVFSLDTSGRVPPGYEDLLPKPWTEIEAALKHGETVELQGQARQWKIVVLASPKASQLVRLIRSSQYLTNLPAGTK
jgi:hypothetical protein